MEKKPPFTWKDKEFWFGWYKPKTYETIDRTETRHFPQWGMLQKVLFGFVVLLYALPIVAVILAAGFLLDYFL